MPIDASQMGREALEIVYECLGMPRLKKVTQDVLGPSMSMQVER